MKKFKASEIFTPEEKILVQKILKEFNGKIVEIRDREAVSNSEVSSSDSRQKTVS